MNEMDKAEVLLISTSVFENKQMSCRYYKKRERECYRINKKGKKKGKQMIVFYVNGDTSEEHTRGV